MDGRRRTVSDGLGPYGDLRRQVDDACGRIGPTREALEQARDGMTEARRALATVHRAVDSARQDADPTRIADAKVQAQATYRSMIAGSRDTMVERRATVEWMTTIDRINRDARRAGQQLARHEREVQRLTGDVARAERLADAARIALESAVAACAEARQALAAIDGSGDTLLGSSVERTERRSGTASFDGTFAAPPAPRLVPHRATTVGAGNDEQGIHRPVLVERMAEGNRAALETAASEVSHVTGQPASHYILLLHELMEALAKVAVERNCLAFDEHHPFWSQFDSSERLAIVASLADLGFRLDPGEGWDYGRMPTVNDLVMALAYAGRDPRMLRVMPTPDDMRGLPASVHVVTLDLLARHAADLTLAQVLEVLGPRAEGFGVLWDDWGRIRPVLLSEADALVA
jgi:hypothetical protein